MTRVYFTLTTLLIIVFHCKAQVNIKSLDSILENAVSKDFFEGTILIADKGNIVYYKSFGFKDYEKLMPITDTTRFGISSITKLFTSIVTMQLIEEGKFQLSDNLKTLLPEFEIPESDKITIHHLLLHISGLPNEEDEIYSQPKIPKEFVTESLSNKSNNLNSFNYANIDYVLLGLIIEKNDNRSWKQSVQHRILEKAEMKNTGFLEMNKYPDDFAYSFSFDDEGRRKQDPKLFIENYFAAACMYSTAKDLLKLDQEMYGNLLLKEKSKKLMYTSYPEYNYSGYGVWTYNYPFAYSQPKIMERRGGIKGANSVLIRLLETNKTIIILSNNNKFNPDSFGNTQSLKKSLIIEVDKSSR